jgi:hypothetical protein
MNSFQKLLDLLEWLDQAHIHYTLAHFRSETIAVQIAVPGERWEVEFFANGNVEVEVFSGRDPGKGLEGEEALERLFAVHGS